MKQFIFIILSTISIIAITSCEYKEEELVSKGLVEELVRFDFPEGDDPWDFKLEELFADTLNPNSLDAFPIYKSFTSADFNKKWTGIGNTPYKYGDMQRTAYTYGDNTFPMAQVYIDFLMDEVFPYYVPEIANKVLPMYLYIADDLRQNNPDEHLMVYKNDGLDYWYLSYYTNTPNYPHAFTYPEDLEYPSDIETIIKWHKKVHGKDTVIELNDDDREVLRACKNAGIYMYMEKAIEKGLIIEPAGFTNGIDYITDVSSTESDDNYFIKRGFVHKVEKRTLIFPDYQAWHFRSLRELGKLSIKTLTDKTRDGYDLKNYICIAMRYTKEEFETQYDPGKYPLVNNRYDLVVNHMRNAYGLDLQEIAAGVKE